MVGRKRDMPTRGWVFAYEALVLYVALGSDMKPQMVPELICETEEEKTFREIVRSRIDLGKQYQLQQVFQGETHVFEPAVYQCPSPCFYSCMHCFQILAPTRTGTCMRACTHTPSRIAPDRALCDGIPSTGANPNGIGAVGKG